jgi:hypothetical protein
MTVGVQTVWQKLQLVRVFWFQLLTALLAGAGMGAAAYYAGPWIAALTSGMGGFVLAMSVHVGLLLRRMRPAFEGLYGQETDTEELC